MKPEIERYITKNYYELQKICKKVTKNSDWYKDLLNEVILQLYDKKEINLKSLEDNDIKYYIIRVITINWYSKTSPFFRKVRRESTLYNELFDQIINELTTEEDIFDNHKILDIIEMEWTQTNWFNKKIFEKYMVLGSLKKVSVDTTIPLTSIARYVNETKKTIRINTFNKLNNED